MARPRTLALPAATRATPSLRSAARLALSLDGEALRAACDEEVFVGGGPGGQHRNKTASAVRLVHRATGLTCVATVRRSQLQNRAAALAQLRERLEVLAREPRVRRKTAPTRGAKERRLAGKRQTSRRKAERRTLGD